MDPRFADFFAGSTGVNAINGGARPPGQMPMLPTGSGATMTDEQKKSDEMFQKVMDLTSGRAKEVQNDPVQKSVMDYLQGVLSGNNVPYTDTVLNSLQAQQGRGSASAEAAQMQSLRDSLGAQGGSIYDPSYQAASREAQSQRQGRNLDYAGQLNAQAGVENFNAKTNAGGMLGQLRGQQNAQINGLDTTAAGWQAQRTMPFPTGTLMPQYMPNMGQAGGRKTAGDNMNPAGDINAQFNAMHPKPDQSPMFGQQPSSQVPQTQTTGNAQWLSPTGPSPNAWQGVPYPYQADTQQNSLLKSSAPQPFDITKLIPGLMNLNGG